MLNRGEDLVIAVGASDKPKAHQLRWANTFGEVAPGDPLLYEDSYGRLCIAVNQGNAATQLGLTDNEVLSISRPRLPASMTAARKLPSTRPPAGRRNREGPDGREGVAGHVDRGWRWQEFAGQ